MRRNVKTIAAPNGSDTALTLALVLGLFGVLAGIGSTGWAATSTLFILAAVAGIGGLVIRNATGDPRKPDKSGENAAAKAQVAELVGPLQRCRFVGVNTRSGVQRESILPVPDEPSSRNLRRPRRSHGGIAPAGTGGVRPDWSECAQRAGRSPFAGP